MMPKSRNRKKPKGRTGRKQHVPLRPLTQNDLRTMVILRDSKQRRGIKP